MDPAGRSSRGRIALGISASSRRHPARRRRQDRRAIADLRSVRRNFHPGAGRRRGSPARAAICRGSGGSGGKPPTEGAGGPARTGRQHHRALRFQPRGLPHPDCAARRLPGASGEHEARDALHHPEPHAACAHDRTPGACGGDEARRQADIPGGGRSHRALCCGRLGTAERRSRTLALVTHLPRAQQHAHRPGQERDLGRFAGRLARHHPGRVLRARAGRPAASPAQDHRGRTAHRVRLSGKPCRRAAQTSL